jgi:hypothetical protein
MDCDMNGVSSEHKNSRGWPEASTLASEAMSFLDWCGDPRPFVLAFLFQQL